MKSASAPDSSPSSSQPAKRDGLRPWPDCEAFCIEGYSTCSDKRCGWRGRWRDARPDERTGKPLCPWCGCASLLRIPLNGVDAK